MMHPALRRLLDSLQEPEKKVYDYSLGESRDRFRKMMTPYVTGPVPKIARVEDVQIPSDGHQILARLYTPVGSPPFPLIVYLHGGGWVIGDIETYDPFCRQLTAGADALVLSIDYRLAPEHPFPAATEDAFTALNWAAQQATDIGSQPDRLFIAGESAGGNLTAVTALLARDRKSPPLSGQILIYPAVDFTQSFPSIDLASRETIIDRSQIEWYYDTYCGAEQNLKDPLISPYWAKDHAHLPPALILLAEYDPLRDEGLAYGEKLRLAGNQTRVILYDQMIHGFLLMGGLVDQAASAIQAIAKFVHGAR